MRDSDRRVTLPGLLLDRIGHVLPGRSGDGVKLRGIGLDEDLFGRLEHVRGRLRGQALGRRCRGLPKSLCRGAAAGDARTGRGRGLPDGFEAAAPPGMRAPGAGRIEAVDGGAGGSGGMEGADGIVGRAGAVGAV